MNTHKPYSLLGDARGFGMLLDAAWQSKKQMADEITNPMIDEMFQEAMKAGALGGKISGAGGGSMFFIVRPGANTRWPKSRSNSVAKWLISNLSRAASSAGE